MVSMSYVLQTSCEISLWQVLIEHPMTPLGYRNKCVAHSRKESLNLGMSEKRARSVGRKG